MALTPTTWDSSYNSAYYTYSNSDLTAADVAPDVYTLWSASTGKFYVEFTFGAAQPVGELFFGLRDSTNAFTVGVDLFGGRTFGAGGMFGTSPYSEAITAPCTIGMYVDMSNGEVGIVTASGDLGIATSGGTGPYKISIYKDEFQYTPLFDVTANFGGSAFTFAVPSGYNTGFGEIVATDGAILTAPKPTVVGYSGGSVALTGPIPVLDSRGRIMLTAPLPAVSAHGGANCAVSAPSPTIEAHFGGNAPSLTQPKATILSVGHDSTGENGAALLGPSATASGHFGGNAQLTAPTGTLDISGTFTVLGAAALTSPAPTVTATGRVSAMGAVAVESPSASLISYGGAVLSITLTGRPTVTATGTSGSVASIAVTAPLFELTASGTAQNHGSINLIAPSGRLGATAQAWLIAPGATLTAIGTAVVAVTYEAYALNLKHANKANDELTRYTNYPFDRIVRYKNSYYGMNATGLYLLEGTTDDGDPIPWEVETHTTDFDSPKLKTVQNAYFGGRLGPGATVTLSVGETADNSYSYTTPRGQTAQNYRQVFGKGAKARYFSLGVSGEDAFELDSLELTVTELARRI